MQTSQLSTQDILNVVTPIVEFIRSTANKAANAPFDMEAFERELEVACANVRRTVIAAELKRHDATAKEIEVAGILYRPCLTSAKTYLTSAGPVPVDRALYRSATGSKAICPLELRVGIVGGFWTPLAARRASWLVQAVTPGAAEQAFRELGVMRPSRASLDRLPKAINARWEAHRTAWERALREQEEVPAAAEVLAISLDGVMAPMRDCDRAAKRNQPDKQPKGPAGFKEVGCGTIALYGVSSENEPERLQTIRYARMPEEHKATLKSELEEEVKSIMSARPDLRVAKLADGARDNWTWLASDRVPEGKEIVDFNHASEHLKRALDAYCGEGTIESKKQFESLKIVLRDEENGVEKTINALRYRSQCASRQRKRIATELGYFRRNRSRMRYWEYQAEGYPIGSGVVEAACKTLVTQRMKNSGMQWGHDGGQAILTLRSLVQSDRWEMSWKMLAESFRSKVVIRPSAANVIPLKDAA